MGKMGCFPISLVRHTSPIDRNDCQYWEVVNMILGGEEHDGEQEESYENISASVRK